jgi:hypothetical protein
MAEAARIVVVRRRGKWWLNAPDLRDSFPDQRTAIEAGIVLAHEAGKHGNAPAVLLQVSQDEVKTIWTYGVDSYPPNRSELLETALLKRRRG